MDIRHLRQVLAIHRTGGFVKAADELGVSQPALSRSIARLEDELRITLFDRSPSGAVLTPLGLSIIARAERLVTESQRLTRDIELMAAGQVGEVRIGVGPSLQTLLPQLGVALADRYPRLRISLNADSRRPLIEGLASGRLDLILLGEGFDTDDPDLVRREILPERMAAVARPDHPLVGRMSVSLDDFVRYPTISPFTTQVFAAMDARFAQRRTDPPPRYITNDLPTVLALMLRTPDCTYIGATHQVEPWLDEGCVSAIALQWDWRLKLSVVLTRAATHSPVISQCADVVAEVCRELLRPGAGRRD